MSSDVTANRLLTHLRTGRDHPVLFRTPHREVRPGYHLTEFKLARVRSVDCGRGAHEWNEGIVELLDGGDGGGEHMRAGKMGAILADVVAELPAIGDAPLVVEFGPEALTRHRIGAVELEADRWTVSLVPLRGQCKAGQEPSCCAPSVTPSASALCCSTSRGC